jgi:flagellar biosynthesis/type III secretory pathway protein FliH
VAELQGRALADAARIATALHDEREQWLADAGVLLVEIAHQAARRLLLEMPAEEQARSSARLLRDEWRAMRGEGQAQLRAHPDDLARLEDIAAGAGWSLASDGLLDRGHCVLSHAAGSLHAHFDENVHALLKALPGARAPEAPRPSTVPDTAPDLLPQPHHETPA